MKPLISVFTFLVFVVSVANVASAAIMCRSPEPLVESIDIWENEGQEATAAHFQLYRNLGICSDYDMIPQPIIDEFGTVEAEATITSNLETGEIKTIYLIKLHDPSGQRPDVWIWNFRKPGEIA